MASLSEVYDGGVAPIAASNMTYSSWPGSLNVRPPGIQLDGVVAGAELGGYPGAGYTEVHAHPEDRRVGPQFRLRRSNNLTNTPTL